MPGRTTLLICYDGSEGARAALEVAATFFAPAEAVVACYWEPFAEASNRVAIDILELVQDPERINEREEALAAGIAVEGEARARAAGLDATGRAVKITTPIDEAVLSHAEELDASAIVLGARSRSPLRSLILGDVANEVVQRATRPVLVVPSRGLSRRRHDALVSDIVDDGPPAGALRTRERD
jgi:nucleotide-binding universal stress UspA family protein